MSTEDEYTHVPMDGGPGVYVADPAWLAEVCARNTRLLAEAHTRSGWYEECLEHPRPAADATDEEHDTWEDTHFAIGDYHTCEERRVTDICVACTLARQSREGTDEVYVAWPCPAVSTRDGEPA